MLQQRITNLKKLNDHLDLENAVLRSYHEDLRINSHEGQEKRNEITPEFSMTGEKSNSLTMLLPPEVKAYIALREMSKLSSEGLASEIVYRKTESEQIGLESVGETVQDNNATVSSRCPALQVSFAQDSIERNYEQLNEAEMRALLSKLKASNSALESQVKNLSRKENDSLRPELKRLQSIDELKQRLKHNQHKTEIQEITKEIAQAKRDYAKVQKILADQKAETNSLFASINEIERKQRQLSRSLKKTQSSMARK